MGQGYACEAMQAAPWANILQTSNEICSTAQARTAAWHERYREYELGFIDAAHRGGFEVMSLNIPVGNFYVGQSSLFPFYLEVAQKTDYLAYGCYTREKTRVYDSLQSDYHEFRWRMFANAAADLGVKTTWLGREALHEPGWRKWLTEEQMIEDWLRFGDVIANDNRMPAVFGFQVGHANWEEYRLTLRWAQKVGEWNKKQQKEVAMPKDYHIESAVPNRKSRDKVKPDLIVIHSTRSGRTGADWTDAHELQATLAEFESEKTGKSAHLSITRTGDWWYLVHWLEAAGHAGYLNARSIGIELTQAVASQPFTGIQVSRCAEAVRWLCDTYHIPKQRVMDEDQPGIIGHEDTAQGRKGGKTDPGLMFPWNEFLAQVGAGPAVVLPTIDWETRAKRAEAKIEAAMGVLKGE